VSQGAHSHGAALALLTVATVASYLGSFGGEFISDDVGAIVENPLLRSLSFANLRGIATTFDDANYIPLKVLSLALDYQLWGLTPAGYHLTNLLLHVTNAAALYALLLRVGDGRGVALAVALLWALHPVHVESVAWISERKNVLSTLCLLLAFHAYLAFRVRPRAGPYAAMVLLYVAALLSKLNTIVLPALVVVYEVNLHRRVSGRLLVAMGPLCVLGIIAAWINLAGNPIHGVEYHGGSLLVTLRTTCTVIPRYLLAIVAPIDLQHVYAVTLRATWLDPTVLGSLAVIGALLSLAAWQWRRASIDAFWLGWFAITLAPMLNLVPFPALMNDRYLYVPMIGALVPLVHGGRWLLSTAGRPALAPAVTALVAAVFGVLTARRVPVFRNEIQLWADTGLRTPYITADRPFPAPPRAEQVRLLTAALAAHPERPALHNNLGGMAFEEGRLADAIPYFERAQVLSPDDPVIALNLGRAYLVAGQVDLGIRHLERAIHVEPSSFYAQLNLARGYLQRGEIRRARAALTNAQSIRRAPRHWAEVEQQLSLAERQPH
jgi:protein O-mannosyl-transferase